MICLFSFGIPDTGIAREILCFTFQRVLAFYIACSSCKVGFLLSSRKPWIAGIGIFMYIVQDLIRNAETLTYVIHRHFAHVYIFVVSLYLFVLCRR